jgi:hypothetical protein
VESKSPSTEFSLVFSANNDISETGGATKKAPTGGFESSALAKIFAENSLNSSPTKKKTSHTGAIVGGVIGGVAGLILVAGIIFFVLRRKQQKKRAEIEAAAGKNDIHEKDADGNVVEKGDDIPAIRNELEGDGAGTEMASPDERDGMAKMDVKDPHTGAVIGHNPHQEPGGFAEMQGDGPPPQELQAEEVIPEIRSGSEKTA